MASSANHIITQYENKCLCEKEGMEVEVKTPTAFIREAALNSRQVPLPMGKTVTYKDVPVLNIEDQQCWLCGGDTLGCGQPVKKVIKPTFTDADRARANNSNSICSGCCFCLSYRELRNYSIIATSEKLIHPTRPEIKHFLLNPPNPPFLFCIAVSGQKWIHFKSEIAYSRNTYPVQMEETKIYVEVADLKKLLNIIEALYTVFTKEEILTGQYNLNRIKQFGLERFQNLAGLAEKYRGNRMFNLALYVAQKRED